MEAERDKNKLDPWKVKHFEPIWGEKREPKLRSGLHCISESRSGGAVTRSSLRLRLESNVDTPVSDAPCPIIVSEDKIEEDNCKVEASINNSEELNQAAGMQELLPAEYNETAHPSVDEKHLESANISSVETIADTEMHQNKAEEDEKVINLPETQDTIVESEVVTQACHENISNSYDKEIHLPRSEKSLQPMEDHILEVSEEDRMLVPDENTSPRSSEQMEQVPHVSTEAASQLPTGCAPQTAIDQVPPMPKEQMPQISDEQIYPMSDCETTTMLETSPSHEQARPTEIVMEDSTLINNNQTETPQVSHVNPTDGESQIPEGMEIDSETLQRIHELEVKLHTTNVRIASAIGLAKGSVCSFPQVRGEMREAYEEISGCPEEIMYPILDGMEMGSNNAEGTETQVVSGQPEAARDQQDVNGGNEDEALREANNYVCSEMLECSWSVDPTVNNINNNNRVST